MNNDKKLIKVNILLDEGRLNTKKNISIGDDNYSGLSWDVWSIIKPRLEKKYKFDVHFTPEKEWRVNHNKVIDNVQNGKYDFVVGVFMHTLERKEKINFTQPIAIDGYAILHKKKNAIVTRFMKSVYPFLRLAFVLIFFGILIGFILYLTDKNRFTYLGIQNKKNNKFFFINRSIMTGVATIFGEMGFLTENVSLNLFKITVVIIIMVFSTMMFDFLQAEMTAKNIEMRKDDIINNNNLIEYNPYLGFKKSAPVKHFKKYNAKVEYLPKMKTSDAIEKYLKQHNEYGGYITTIGLGLEYMNKYSQLDIAYGDFGYEPISFIVKKNKTDFLNDLDKEILILRDSQKLSKICRIYYPISWGIHPICSLSGN